MGYKPVIGITEKDKNEYYSKKFSIKEEFKGEVIDKNIKFPKELGAEHPFNFEDSETIYSNVGIINAAINKYADAIVSDFSVELDNPNSQAIIDDFIENTNFINQLRTFTKEALAKGNGFIEIDLNTDDDTRKVRVMNANDMYVKRNKKGKVLGYNQYLGNKNFRKSINQNRLIPFKPNQIAHFKINKLPNQPYGIGLIHPNMATISNFAGGEVNLAKLLERKAGAPIVVNVGQPGDIVLKEDINQVKSDLQYMNGNTEWVLDGSMKAEVLDFKGVGENWLNYSDHNIELLAAGFEMPVVLFGKANVPEGLAKAQSEAWQRKIKSRQQELGEVIAENIFRPLLRKNGLDEVITFKWNLPGEDEINKRIEKITALLAQFNLSENLRRLLNLELAKLLDLKDAEKFLRTPEVGLDDKKEEELKAEKEAFANKKIDKSPDKSPEAKKEKKIKQPEVPGAKPSAKQSLKLTESQIAQMSIKEFVNLKEIPGFNYTDYLIKILEILRKDPFTDIKAITEKDIANGLLPKKEVEKLRIVLKDGFRKNKTMAQIETDIKENVKLSDRLRDGKIIVASQFRPNMIARTETVRLANEGLVSLYKEHNIEKVRWLSALSDRTCKECEALNGQVFELNNMSVGINQPPLHVACRCSLVSIVE